MLDLLKGPEQIRRDLKARMSLRVPQERSLDILADVLDCARIGRAADLDAIRVAINARYPSVEDFERDFPSLCFALCHRRRQDAAARGLRRLPVPDRPLPQLLCPLRPTRQFTTSSLPT